MTKRVQVQQHSILTSAVESTLIEISLEVSPGEKLMTPSSIFS